MYDPALPKVTRMIRLYLSEMCGPVYGRPAVEGVLHSEVSRVRGAPKEGAQGTDVSVPAGSMEREAAV